MSKQEGGVCFKPQSVIQVYSKMLNPISLLVTAKPDLICFMKLELKSHRVVHNTDISPVQWDISSVI